MKQPPLVRAVAALAVWVVILAGTRAAAQTPVKLEPKPAPQQTDDQDVINPDRPGIADGSTVIGRGRFQLEAGFQQEFRNVEGGTDHTHFLPTLVRIGLSSRWEARVEGNTFTQVSTSAPGAVSSQTSGWAPTSFGVKFHMQDSAGLRQPSLGAIVRVFPASGTNGLGTDKATGDLRLVADWDLTPNLSLNPNVGVARYEDDGNRTFTAGLFALTLSYFNAAKTLNPFIDVGIQAPEGSAAGSSIVIDGGIAYLPGRDVQIDVSVGAGPHGHTPPHRFFAIGLSLRLGASKS